MKLVYPYLRPYLLMPALFLLAGCSSDSTPDWAEMKVGGGTAKASGGGRVLVGSDKGDVLAYDENGKVLWKSKVPSEVLSVPQVADGVVMVRSGDGRIAGLSAADGKRLWLYERSTPAPGVRIHDGVSGQACRA